MHFTQDDIRRIKEASKGRLLDVIGDFHELRKRGSEYKCECPKCHGQEKLHISPAKQIFKCFSCPDIKGTEPLDYLQRAEDMQFLEACDYLARKFNVLLDPKPEKKPVTPKMKKRSKEAKGENVDTFCARMLAGSGLTYQDVTAHIFKKGDTQSIFEAKTFRPGTVDEYGNIVDGDDVIIEYYDLDACRSLICANFRDVANRNPRCIIAFAGSFRMNIGTRKENRSNTNLLPAAVHLYTFRNV